MLEAILETFFVFLLFQPVFLNFLGQFLSLLLIYVRMQMFGCVAQCWGKQEFSILA